MISHTQHKLSTIFLWLTLIWSLSGLVLMYVFSFGGRGLPLMGIPRFLSFFTILSNILGTIAVLKEIQKPGALCSTFGSSTLVYLIITCVVYSALLRGVWAPAGWILLADILLHYLTPMGILLSWIFSVRMNPDTRKSEPYGLTGAFMGKVLLFPAAYLILTMLAGTITQRFPYPFLNVQSLGIVQVGINSMVIAMGFILISWLIWLLDKLLWKWS